MEWDIIADRLSELEDTIVNSCQEHDPTELGLDYRCGRILVGPGYIATTNRGGLDYYGGFQYIEPEFIQVVGFLTLYSHEHGRVRECLHTLKEKS